MKPIIYQLLPRLFTNVNPNCVPNGTFDQNGSGKLNHITPEILASIKQLGATHIWYTGILEHATRTRYLTSGILPDNPYVVKGEAGSPYAIKDYYDIDPDLAEEPMQRMSEFEALVRRTNKAGLKVIMDFVPNHVAREYRSDVKPAGVVDFGQDDDTSVWFRRDNNFYYIPRQLFAPHVNLGKGRDAYVEFPARASGNDCFSAFPGVNDWYDTVKLNYGIDYGNGSRQFDSIPDTWHKMLHILRFWASKGIDGFRCDMVHMVPLEFWQWAIPAVKEQYPNIIFIAEIYEVALYRDFLSRGGFDYLYDKVTLYDTLRNIQTSNYSAAQITNCWQTVEGISSNMLNFLENHDEQRFGSPQYAGDPSLVLPSLIVSSMINTGAMMIYMGQELGEQALDAEGFSGLDGRTTIFDYWSVPTLRRWLGQNRIPSESNLHPQQRSLRKLYQRVLTLCNTEKAISLGSFFDVMYVNYNNPTFNPHRQYAFLRHYAGEVLVIVVNFSDQPTLPSIQIPEHAFDVMGIKPLTSHKATELLTGQELTKNLSPNLPFETAIPAYGAVVWKFDTVKPKKRATTAAQKPKKA